MKPRTVSKPPVRVPITATEEAYTRLVLEEHAALIRQADARRDQRMAVLLTEKGIPTAAPIQLVPATETTPACFTYPA
jgi:hypothetical protein